MTRRHPLRAAVAVLTVALFAGCSRTGDPSADGVSLPANTSISATAVPETTANSTTTTTAAPGGTAPDGTPWTPDQVAAIEVYRAFDEAYRRAALTSDPADAGLDQTSSGDVLVANRALMVQRRNAGQAVRPSAKHLTRFEVVSVAPKADAMNVVVCEVDDDVVYNVGDGSVVNDEITTKRRGALITAGKVAALGTDKSLQWSGDQMETCVDA